MILTYGSDASVIVEGFCLTRYIPVYTTTPVA